MDSQAAMKLMKLFYETPQAQEIYATLRRQREEEQKANYESLFIDIPDEPVKKTTKVFIEQDKVATSDYKQISGPISDEFKQKLDSSPDKARQDLEPFDEPLCTCDDEPTTSAALFSECESKSSQVFQNVEKYDSLLQDNQKQRELLKWSLKIVNEKDIIVEGHRSGDPSDMSWRTSMIYDRVSTNAVRSVKGTLYFLLGEIDETDMIGKGFSEEIINMFRYGFPPNWRDIFMSKTVPEQHERDNKVKVNNEKKTPVMVNDCKNESLNEEENAVHITQGNMTSSPTKQSDKLPRKRYSKRNTIEKETSKKKKPLSEPRRQKGQKEKTKRLLSNTIETDDAKEIEVKRSRSGRLICPVLDYWKGQRIDTSQADLGEISIIKSNLEDDLRLTLVGTSKNSNGTLQNPTVSSTESTGTTYNTSGKEWTAGSIETDSTSTNAARNLTRKNSARKVTKTKSLQVKSQSDEAIFTGSETEALENEKPKKYSRTKSAKQTTTTSKSRKRKQSGEISESETSAVELQEISKSTNKQKPERITKTSTTQSINKVNLTDRSSTMTKVYPAKTSTRIDEEGDSEQCDVEQVQPNNFKTNSTGEITRTYPKRTRIRVDEWSEKSTVSYPSTTQRQVTENVVKQAKSTNSSRSTKQVKQSVKESQTQPSKKSKVETGKLTKRMGTLARKRELRDMLEQQDEGYEDDAFEGTPFRNQKLSRTHNVSPVDIAISEDSPEEVNDEDYTTPSNRKNRLRPAGPLSTGKSENDVMTPGLLNSVNRNNLDRYVNQLRRQKLRNLRNVRKKVESHTTLAKKPGNTAHDIPGGVDYSFNIHTKSTAMDDEEDEEGEDYYWSDND